LGRKNVPFNGQQAPLPVKRDFSDLSLGAPPGMDPGAIASQARKVATFRIDGKAHVLWVAPTRSGGLCETFTDMFGGCRKSRTPPKRYPRGPGAVNPFLLGLTSMGSPTTLVGGDILAPNAQTLLVEYENNATSPIPFVFVSKPIDAGFFLYKIPAGHTKAGTRVRAVLVRDAHGRLLARVPIVVPPVHRPPT